MESTLPTTKITEAKHVTYAEQLHAKARKRLATLAGDYCNRALLHLGDGSQVNRECEKILQSVVQRSDGRLTYDILDRMLLSADASFCNEQKTDSSYFMVLDDACNIRLSKWMNANQIPDDSITKDERSKMFRALVSEHIGENIFTALFQEQCGLPLKKEEAASRNAQLEKMLNLLFPGSQKEFLDIKKREFSTIDEWEKRGIREELFAFYRNKAKDFFEKYPRLLEIKGVPKSPSRLQETLILMFAENVFAHTMRTGIKEPSASYKDDQSLINAIENFDDEFGQKNRLKIEASLRKAVLATGKSTVAWQQEKLQGF